MTKRSWILTVVLWTAALSVGSGRQVASAPHVKAREVRTWHANGQLASVRRYQDGREHGLQQSWTPEGVLYLNYEVRNGRRYGLVNARPCEPAEVM